jgi:hypothetical protein
MSGNAGGTSILNSSGPHLGALCSAMSMRRTDGVSMTSRATDVSRVANAWGI